MRNAPDASPASSALFSESVMLGAAFWFYHMPPLQNGDSRRSISFSTAFSVFISKICFNICIFYILTIKVLNSFYVLQRKYC